MLIPSSTERIALATLTWLGHASFRVDTDAGTESTSTRSSPGRRPRTASGSRIAPTRSRSRTATATTRRRRRHAAAHGCTVVGMIELVAWFTAQGVPDDKAIGFNKGGTVEVAGVRFTMTHAFHSSSAPDGTYAGEPAGLHRRARTARRVYFAGDTAVFGDMALIARLYSPTSPCSRSATTSRWARARPRWRSSCSATRAASRATGAPSDPDRHARRARGADDGHRRAHSSRETIEL